MYSPYNPCCTGSFYGTGCTPDCADAIAWRAYRKAWPEAMAGMREVFIGGSSLGRREVVQTGSCIGPSMTPCRATTTTG